MKKEKKVYKKPIMKPFGAVKTQTMGGNSSTKSDHGMDMMWTS